MITGPWKYVAAGLLALVLIAGILAGVKGCKEVDQANRNTLVNAGVTKERSEGQTEVINHVQEARNVVERPTDVERNVVCSKYDRNCPNGK